MTKSARWWLWSCYLYGWSGGVFSEGHTETHKRLFFPYKQVGEMVIMNDIE